MMKKYFLSEFFSNIKSLLSAFKRDQLELLGVSEREATHETIHRPPPRPEGQITVFIYGQVFSQSGHEATIKILSLVSVWSQSGLRLPLTSGPVSLARRICQSAVWSSLPSPQSLV